MHHTRALVALLAVPFLAPSAGAQTDTTPPLFVGAPVVVANSNPAAILTAEIKLTTNEPTKIELTIRDSTRTWRTVTSQKFSSIHDEPLVGMRPNRMHRIVVTVVDQAGNRTTLPYGLTYTTPPLPANFPPLSLATSVPSQMEPGVTLTTLRYSSPTLPASGAFCVFLDGAGEVVWIYETTSGVRDAIRMRNGHFLVNASNRLVQEIDLFGNVARQWWAARLGLVGMPAGAVPVDCDSFHHELHELSGIENGNLIALSTEMRSFTNYPTSEIDPTQTAPVANVVGDVIVEFRPDGTLVRECKMLGVLDPYRLTYGSLANFYNVLYGTNTYDWSHGNAVDVDTTDDTWVISLRHQDAVVKVRRADNSIVWIHGPHERWNAPWSNYLLTPIGGAFEWNFHEHSPHFDGAGNLTMFDNGNYRVTPPAIAAPTDQWYSRLVRFHVDPIAMTTQQVWEYSGATPFFSGMFGDADTLPATGNVLGVDGAKPWPGQNKSYSRLVEVTPAGTPVWEVVVNDPAGATTNPFNWNLYRAQRYPSIYVQPQP